MKVAFAIEKPADVPVTMTVTMTLGEWRRLSDLIRSEPGYAGAYPLYSAIADVTQKATKTFWPTPETEDA